MSELVFGGLCFAAGAIVAVTVPKFFAWVADKISTFR